MDAPQILDLETLLSPHIGDKKIAFYTTNNLTEPGENYGSVMVALDVKLEDEEEAVEELHLVAKMCPPNEFMKKLFKVNITFKKELYFYKYVVPTLKAFQRERGCKKIIDSFAKYYSSRFSLNPSTDEVDSDACILLENVKVHGYFMADRIEGFTLEAAEFLIKDLALFHAIPLAIKMMQPSRFEKHILPSLVKSNVGEELIDDLQTLVLDVVKNDPKCSQHLDRLKERFNINIRNMEGSNLEDNNMFSTVVHSDYWVNNAMLLCDANGKVVDNIIIDFQTTAYGNPTKDLIFFIYSSLSVDIIDQHYQKLILLYYSTFIKALAELGVDTEPFNYKAFQEQIDKAAKETEVFHILVMFKPIFGDKEKAKELGEFSDKDELKTDDVTSRYFEKMRHAVLDFANKGWI